MSLFAVPLGTNNGASGLYMTDTEIGQQNQSFAKTCKTPNNHGFFSLIPQISGIKFDPIHFCCSFCPLAVGTDSGHGHAERIAGCHGRDSGS